MHTRAAGITGPEAQVARQLCAAQVHTPGVQLQALCAPVAQAPAFGCCGCLSQRVSLDNEFVHSLSGQGEVLVCSAVAKLGCILCLLACFAYSYSVLAVCTSQTCCLYSQADRLQAAQHGSSDLAGATVRQPPALSKRAC